MSGFNIALFYFLINTVPTYRLSVTIKVKNIPCKGTADAQIKLLSCIHSQGFVVIRFTQAAHGVTDVCVGDGAKLCPINTSLPGAPLVHYWLNGIQYLSGTRNDTLPVQN